MILLMSRYTMVCVYTRVLRNYHLSAPRNGTLKVSNPEREII